MPLQTRWEKFIYWFVSLFERYDCTKERHRWGYLLSQSGVVYMDDSKVPPELWHCLDCGTRKYPVL